MFPDTDDLEFFARIKQQIDLMNQCINEPENVEQARNTLAKIDKFFIDLQKPKNFRANTKDNAIVLLELSYQELCALLENNGTPSPKALNLFEFYSRISYLKKTGPKVRL